MAGLLIDIAWTITMSTVDSTGVHRMTPEYTELSARLAELKRAIPRNPLVLAVCEAFERLPTGNEHTDNASKLAIRKAQRRQYKRAWMKAARDADRAFGGKARW